MKLTNVRIMLITLLGLLLVNGNVCSMTIQLGSERTEFIAPGDTWKFYRGSEAPNVSPDAWKEINFDDSHWEVGTSGFGYGDDDDVTILADMQGNYTTVYIRKEFLVSSLTGDEVLELVIDYDDGFIAYLNGQEVARRHMPDGPATYETMASSHEAGTPETIVLGRAGGLLNEGSNIIAIEGHNNSIDSSDFSLIPALRTATDIIRNGQTWIVGAEMVMLRGRTDDVAVSVKVNGTNADFYVDDGTWWGKILLAAGLNTITVEALDAEANTVDSASIRIVYVPPVDSLSGELTENIIWSGAVIIEDTVVVSAGTVVIIEPGTMVLIKQGAALIVYGQLIAEGTEEEPIRFTHHGDGTTWKQIMFVEAADSRFAHCFIEYADSEGAHQDYYEPGPRSYHEAIVALASHVDIEECVFQNLPDESASAEGDAIAIVSDDPVYPGKATAHIKGCQFLSIGQGVHTRYSYVLVEDCFFTGKNGDNDDVDLWGESDPAPLIKNNIFLNPDHDDMINPTRCSAVIIGNVIAGSDDHGIVLRDKCFPVVMNNLIYDCSSAGIAIENSCEALLVNNTIVDCGRGLRLFDLGRWDPPYSLNPGGGTATVANCIIWNCPQPITLTDSSNTQIKDRGSHVTVSYCDIKGGRDALSISGTYSTVVWGQGNIDNDPQFVDPDNNDFHLKSQGSRWDAVHESWIKNDITSPCIDAGEPTSPIGHEPFPNGGIINMGAYGGTAKASKSYFGEPVCKTIVAGDINGDCKIDFVDFQFMAYHWLENDNP